MKKEDKEQVIQEDDLKPISINLLKNSLDSSRGLLFESQIIAREFGNLFQEFQKFVNEINQGARQISEENRLEFYEKSISGLLMWLKKESERLQTRPLVIQERIRTLEGVLEHALSTKDSSE